MLRRSERRAVLGDGKLRDERFAKDCPVLWDHLTQTAWEDGSKRKLSTIGIYPEPGIIRVLFRDVDAGLMTWVAVTCLTDVFHALEAVLNDSGADWRVDRRAPGQQASRVRDPLSSPNGVDKRGKKR